ncbi:type II secretion system F family protein [Enterobacter kobei]|uniref:type II secretion system F family protein n=1 Tax=Enterobacter kobei TaxID=208224 RepID=UPI003CEEE9F6
MIHYRYRLLQPDGKVFRGTLKAKDITDARQRLSHREGTLLSLRQQAFSLTLPTVFRQTVSVHRAIKQLALMTGARLPLRESLALIVKEQVQGQMRSTMETLYQQVCEGVTLSAAMAQQPRYFDALCCATIAAGEQSGEMAAVLNGYAQFLDKQHQLRRSLQQALSYPLLLLMVSCLIVGLLLTVAVPQIVSQLSLSGVALPWSTELVLLIGEGIKNYSLPAAGVATICLVLACRFLRNPARRRVFDGTLLKLPVLGRLLQQTQQVKLLMTLSILCTTAVPVADALRLSCRALTNQWLKARGEAAVQGLTEGQSFTQALNGKSLLPADVLALLHAGEQGGKLADALDYVARTQQEALQQRLLSMVKLLEPVMILILGGIVLLVFMAIIQPMLNMNSMAI